MVYQHTMINDKDIVEVYDISENNLVYYTGDDIADIKPDTLVTFKIQKDIILFTEQEKYNLRTKQWENIPENQRKTVTVSSFKLEKGKLYLYSFVNGHKNLNILEKLKKIDIQPIMKSSGVKK